MVSSVGRDFLGREVRRRVGQWDLDDGFITEDRRHPTGTVLATLDARGAATYRIAEHVAWDHIEAPPSLRRTPEPAAVVFGTLALRGRNNRAALDQLLDAWPGALRVLDLNLRTPFDRGPAIAFALKRAQLLKLNDEELGRLTGKRVRTPAAIRSAAAACARRYGLSHVSVTAGGRGAGLLWKGVWYWERGRPVKVRDTVGAGDSFLGALVAALVSGHVRPEVALARACRVGEFVATCDGATPPYRVEGSRILKG